MKKIILLSAAILTATNLAISQGTAINTSGAAADNSALLDLSSTTKGTLITRMTTSQQNAIVLPAVGLIVYNLDCNSINYYNGAAWISLGNIGSLTTPGSISGNTTPCQNEAGVSYSTGSVSGATAYNWSVPSGSTVVSGQGTNSVNVNFGSTNGNLCVTAFNACGSSNATCMTVNLQQPPVSPAEGIHSSTGSQIIWNWYVASGATGYKWNTADDYNSAVDMGSATSKNETGLTCNTVYTRYIWAYNNCGHSASTQISGNSGGGQATGGTITYTDASGLNPRSSPPYTDGYTVHTFTSSGTFTPSACINHVDALVVAGGGAGGNNHAGGGGAGGYIWQASFAVSAQPYTVTVGNGGVASGDNCDQNTSGGNSEFSTLTAIGGGFGGNRSDGCNLYTGGNGGSGGGGGGEGGMNAPGGSGTSGQGYAGGNGYGADEPSSGGGGGGASATGANGASYVAGNGGDGVSNSISGVSVYYAGGGGGGASKLVNSTSGNGGTGGGGKGGYCSGGAIPPVAGTANTGGGGGGGYGALGTGADGGSGIVIIRYLTN